MTYLDEVPEPVTHELDSPLTAAQISAGRPELSAGTVYADRWQHGDRAVVTSRDGHVFSGSVTGLCTVTGGLRVRLAPGSADGL